MRLGVFGGTFDPIHLGHLILAEQCRDQANLDRLLFLPSARPPNKLERVLTPYHHRVEMLTLAISGQPPFQISEIERDRPGPSYTADTLEELKMEYAGAEMFFILGSDSVRDLPNWYEPARILASAHLLVVARHGSEIPSEIEFRRSLGEELAKSFRYQVVEMPLVTIASRDLRNRLQEGRSIRYMLPRAVQAYIAEKGLYV